MDQGSNRSPSIYHSDDLTLSKLSEPQFPQVSDVCSDATLIGFNEWKNLLK